MTDTTDARALEHEVEEARSRLANTIDRLASPETAEATKEDIKAYAQSTKDEIAAYLSAKVDETTEYLTKAKDEAIENAREAAQSKVQSFTEDLKERARANPLAVGLIGAGIAWRLYKHPPVTTVLIGSGIALLMNGPARTRRSVRDDPYDDRHPTSYVPGGIAGQGYSDGRGGSVAGQVQDAVARAGELGQEIGSRAWNAASEASARVSEAASGAAARLGEAAAEAGARTGEYAEGVAARARETLSGLAGRASEARGEAEARTWEAAQRAGETAGEFRARASLAADHASRSVRAGAADLASNARYVVERGRGNPYVVGGVGLACGLVLWRALQESEAGSRFLDRTGHSIRNAAYQANATAASATRRTGARASGLASAALDTVSGTLSDTLEAVRGAPSKASRAARDASSRIGGTIGATRATSGRGGASRPAARGIGQSAVGRWFDDEVLAMPERYPLLVTALGFAIGAAAGGSIRLTDAERQTIGPVSGDVGRRALDVAHEQYEHVVESAREAADELKSRLRPEPEAKDLSSDFETVLGGGPPPAQQGSTAAQPTGGSAGSAAAGYAGKSQAGPGPGGKDLSSDFETVLGGGPPPVEQGATQTARAAGPAGSGPGAGPTRGDGNLS